MNFREYKLKYLKAMAMYKSKEQELQMKILGKKVYACEKFCVKDKKKYWKNLTFRIKKNVLSNKYCNGL